jgi:hypothetical protein
MPQAKTLTRQEPKNAEPPLKLVPKSNKFVRRLKSETPVLKKKFVGLLPSNREAKIDKLKQEKHINTSINEPEIKPRKEVYIKPPEVYVSKGPARNKFASLIGHKARNTSTSTVTDKELLLSPSVLNY